MFSKASNQNLCVGFSFSANYSVSFPSWEFLPPAPPRSKCPAGPGPQLDVGPVPTESESWVQIRDSLLLLLLTIKIFISF